MSLNCFSTYQFDFENKQARSVEDPKDASDAVHKQYVGEIFLNNHRKIEDSLQTVVARTVRSKILRMMSKAAGACDERSADDNECDMETLIKRKLGHIRCAVIF